MLNRRIGLSIIAVFVIISFSAFVSSPAHAQLATVEVQAQGPGHGATTLTVSTYSGSTLLYSARYDCPSLRCGASYPAESGNVVDVAVSTRAAKCVKSFNIATGGYFTAQVDERLSCVRLGGAYDTSESWSGSVPYPPPVAGAPTPSVASVDYGQTVIFTANPSGGTGTYTTYAWFGLPPGCTGTTTATPSCVPTTGAGSYSITYTVTDTAPHTSSPSPALAFTVYTSVGASPSASVNPLGEGDTTYISASPSGGTGSYGYAWSGLPTGCTSPGNVEAFNCTPASGTSAALPYTVQVIVTDSNGESATTSFGLTVNPALGAAPSADSNPVDVGSSTRIAANAAGGSGVYTSYAWSGLPSGCGSPGNVPSFDCTPSSGDDSHSPYTVQVVVTDSGSGTVTKTFSLTVLPGLTVSPTATTNPVTEGGSTTVNANAAGGSGTYTSYVWSGSVPPSGSCDLPSDTTTSSFSCGTSSGEAGYYDITVEVTDTDGYTATNSFTLTVEASGGGCVLSGTLITLADGTQVPVQDLKVGDTVLSYNITSGQVFTTTVTSNDALVVGQVVDINNGALYASGLNDQPLYVQLSNGTQKWVDLGELQVGMKLFDPITGTWTPITSVAVLNGTFTVYDLRVTGAPNNDYVGNSFLILDKIPTG